MATKYGTSGNPFNTDSSYTITSFPIQTLTTKQKIDKYGSVEDWEKACVNAIIGFANSATVWSNNLNLNEKLFARYMYSLYNGDFDQDEYKYVTQPLGEKFQFPAKLRNYNIIKPVVDVLVGEEQLRPFSYYAYGVNPEVADEKLNIEIQGQVAAYMKNTVEQLKQQFGIEIQNNYEGVIEEYNAYMKGNGKLSIEKLATDLLDDLYYKTEFRYKAAEGFLDYLITSREIYKIDVYDKNIVLRVINPANFWCSKPQHSIYIHDALMACEDRWMTMSDILEAYGDDLDDEAVEELANFATSPNNAYPAGGSIASTNFMGIWNGMFRIENNELSVLVHCTEWVSQRLVVEVEREDGSCEYYYDGKEVKEDVPSFEHISKYEEKPGDKKKKRWLNEVWEGVRIGPSIYPYIRPKKVQNRKYMNPNDVELGFRGIWRGNKNNFLSSFVNNGKVYQILYNILMYRLEMTIAQAKGKFVVLDLAQIPTSKGMTPADILYHAHTDGALFVDTTQISESGMPSTYNQWTTVDLTLSQSAEVYIALMQYVLSEWERLCGVNKERQGAANDPGQTATATVSNREQSNYITQYLFAHHQQAKKSVITGLLNTAKEVYDEYGYKSQYAIGDGNVKMIRILPGDMTFYDFGVHVDDDSRLAQIQRKLDEYIAMSVQSGQVTLADILQVLQETSITGMKEKMNAIFKRKEEMLQKQQEMEAKIQQEQLNWEKEMKEKEIQFNTWKTNEDNKTKIIVAEINERQQYYTETIKQIKEKQSEEDSINKQVNKKLEKNTKKLKEKIEEDNENEELED